MASNEEREQKSLILVVGASGTNADTIKNALGGARRLLVIDTDKPSMSLLRQENVDLVMLGLQAHAADAAGLITAMKADYALSEIPILVIADAAEDAANQAEMDALMLGADDCLNLPCDALIMRKRVENLIDRYSLRAMRKRIREQKKARTMLDMLGIAYWEWKKPDSYYCSKEYENYAVSEMDKEKIWDAEAPFEYVHPDDVPLMRRFMQQYDAGEIKKSAVVRCRLKDGNYQWTEMFSYAEMDADGQLEHIVSAMRNVDKEWVSNLAAEQKNRELNHIIDSTAGGVVTYLVGEKLSLTSYTNRIVEALGYSPEDMKDASARDAFGFIYPTDVAIMKAKLQETADTRKPTLISYRIRKKDGSYKWFRANFFYDGEQDGCAKIYAVLSDIQVANAEYADALNQTNELVMVADWDSREIFYINEPTAKMAGKTIAEMTGKKCSQIAFHCDERCSYCFKDELNYDELTIRPISVGKKYFLTKGKRMLWNGREAFVEYVSDITAEHNMTERVVFERNLLSSATRKLFPMCIIGNLTQNTYNIIEYDSFNTKKAATDGCFDELIKVGASTIPEQDRAAFITAFSRENLQKVYAEGKKMVPLVHRQIGDDGLVHWNRTVAVFADQLFDGDLYIMTFTDNLDELKNAEESLKTALAAAEQANEAKTAFLSRVSHDMRTPLNGILGLTTILRDRITDDKANGELAELELSGKYLLNLINDTLDVSRIENGKLELHPSVCDSRSLFNNIVTLVKINAKSKNITLNIDTENLEFPMLYMDTARFEQVFLNVAGNAVKFTPENGKVDIIISNIAAENGVFTEKFVIRDYGVGMSKEFLPHIFEPFSQADQSRTNAYQGTGLGMTITKQLVKLMDGTIEVESELGKGTCFTITVKLPIATDAEIEEWKKNRISIDDGVGLAGKRILLCEDHPLNTKIATKLLQAKGMLVEHAENGTVGVEKFDVSAPGYYDAILMDIRMPVMDGLDATRAIRALPRRDAQSIPIIAMTANAFAEDIRQTQEAGMNAHLSKPVQTDLLYSTLADVLDVQSIITKPIILVVDDMEVNRAIIRCTLEDDYELLEAENGKRAMEIIRNTRGIKAVITDIQMPQMDGVELIKQIRSNDDYRHIVIIANTQFGDPQQEETLLKIGANDFVYKPTTPKIVEIRVRNALKRM